MTKIKTSELTGAALDWAVAKAEGFKPFTDGISWIIDNAGTYQQIPKYSVDWAQGGPIIERENLCVGRKHQPDLDYCPINDPKVECWARTTAGGYLSYGSTPLIAAMRCYVASKLGEDVSIPEELIK